jgi:hypothetical protein
MILSSVVVNSSSDPLSRKSVASLKFVWKTKTTYDGWTLLKHRTGNNSSNYNFLKFYFTSNDHWKKWMKLEKSWKKWCFCFLFRPGTLHSRGNFVKTIFQAWHNLLPMRGLPTPTRSFLRPIKSGGIKYANMLMWSLIMISLS